MTYDKKILVEAKKLRRQGSSLIQISRKFNIAKSTASLWVKDVPLNQKIASKLKNRELIGRQKALEILRIKRELEKEKIDFNADKTVSHFLNAKKQFWQVCAALITSVPLKFRGERVVGRLLGELF